MSRFLFMLGGFPFIVFGLVHVLMTPLTRDQDKALAPREPAFRVAMSEQTPLLTRRTNIWLAWVGFNLSHGLGLGLFGAAVLIIGRSQASFAGQSSTFVPLGVLVSLAYFGIGMFYWFRTPILATIFAAVCFATSWMLRTP